MTKTSMARPTGQKCGPEAVRGLWKFSSPEVTCVAHLSACREPPRDQRTGRDVAQQAHSSLEVLSDPAGN